MDSELVTLEFQCTLLWSPGLLLQITFSCSNLFRRRSPRVLFDGGRAGWAAVNDDGTFDLEYKARL